MMPEQTSHPARSFLRCITEKDDGGGGGGGGSLSELFIRFIACDDDDDEGPAIIHLLYFRDRPNDKEKNSCTAQHSTAEQSAPY